MFEMILDILSWVFFLAGSAFVLIGAIGVLRFPDFYTRLHAAGVTDTLGVDLVLLAMVFQSGDMLTMVKLFLIFLILALTSPVSTHAVSHAAWADDVNPMVGKDLHYADDDTEAGRSDEEHA